MIPKIRLMPKFEVQLKVCTAVSISVSNAVEDVITANRRNLLHHDVSFKLSGMRNRVERTVRDPIRDDLEPQLLWRPLR